MLLLGDIRRLRNPRDAFARSAATTGRDTLSTLRALSLSLFLSPVSSLCTSTFPRCTGTHHPLSPASLSLSQQIATITYMCRYITHPCWPRLPHNPLSKPASPHRSPLSPSSPRVYLSIHRTNKVHRYESSVFQRCSHPIPHLRLSIPSLDPPPLPSTLRGSLLFLSSLSSPSRSLGLAEEKVSGRLADFSRPPSRRANGTFFISGFTSCRDPESGNLFLSGV